MKYKTYIFDLDGTLLDTLQDLANAVNYAMRQMNYPERTVDEVRRFIGNGIRMLIKRAAPQDISQNDYDKTLAIFIAYYLDHIADFTKPYDGIIDVIKTLKENGCKVAVVSNKADEAAKRLLRISSEIFLTLLSERWIVSRQSLRPIRCFMLLKRSERTRQNAFTRVTLRLMYIRRTMRDFPASA